MDSVTELSNLETETQTIADPTLPPGKAPRDTSTIASGIVTFNDAEEYALGALPAAVQGQLAAIGLRDVLRNADNRLDMFAKLAAGNVPGKKAAAPKQLAPARKAIALAMADAKAAEQGIKRFAPGGKVNADYAVILEDCEQVAAGMDRADAAAWSKKRAVMEHLAKLIGE